MSSRQQVKIEDHDSDQRLMRIGEVSEKSGIAVETLRFYERSGLLAPPMRTDSGYRLYSSNTLMTLEFIKRAQKIGFTLNEIRQIIDDGRSGKNPCDDVRKIVRVRLTELDEQLIQMQKYRDALANTLKQWDKTGRAEGHYCGLIESSDFQYELTKKKEKKNRKNI